MGGVQYRGGYHDKCGRYLEYREGLSGVPWRKLSTVGDIMMHVGDIMSTVGVFSEDLLSFEYPHGTEHPHSTHDIPHMYPHGTQITKDRIPTVLNTPTVLMISPRAS